MKHVKSLAAVAAISAGLLVAGSEPASSHSHDSPFGHHGAAAGWKSWWHPATAHHPKPPSTPTAGTPTTLASGLVGPLTLDVAPDGSVYVGQSDFSPAATSKITRIAPGGAQTDVVTRPGVGDLAAVSYRNGVLTWGERQGPDGAATAGDVFRRAADGTISHVADTLERDRTHNPDGATPYGFADLAPGCTVPPSFAYAGLVDTHPYASLVVGQYTYVADAGANAILRIDATGRIKTVAVLPPADVTVTAEAAAAFGLPACVAGTRYSLEAVPTDVELGPDGWLYVSSLPGGPEDGSLGANGAVYRVNPGTGQVRRLATGLAGATGLAVAPDGTVFVSEIVGNDVVSISRDGTVSSFVSLPQPAGVEWHAGALYVTDNVFGPGQVVRIPIL